MRAALVFLGLAFAASAQTLSVQTVNTSRINAGTTSNIITLNSGLLAWYKFEEGSGTTVADSSGNSRTATMQAQTPQPTFVAGTVGSYAVNFDPSQNVETSGRFLCGDFADNLSELAIAGWVKKASGGYDGQNTLVSRLDGPSDTGWYVMDESGTLRFVYGNATEWVETQGTQITDYAWHHFAFNKKSNGDLEQWADGVLLTGALSGTGAGSVSTYSNTNKVMLGWSGVHYKPSLKGSIDEIRIYNRILSSNEIWGLSHP